ncbi:autotransporter-associated beta strand repeat-containing protein [Phycisphaeraceae bacterium D3-23]
MAIRILSLWRPSTAALLAAGLTCAPALSEVWTDDGDNSQWSNPENWTPESVPGAGDNASFNGGFGASSSIIQFNTSATVSNMTFSDWPSGLGTLINVNITMNGSPGRTLTAGLFTLDAGESTLDTGVVTVSLYDMTVNARPNFDSDGDGELNLLLDDTTFMTNTSTSLDSENLDIFLVGDSVFGNTGSTLYTPGSNTRIFFSEGGALDWATLYDDNAGQSMTVNAGGGSIYNDFSGLGNISVAGGLSAVLSFGDPDSTASHSAAVSGVISGNGGVAVNSENYELTLLGSNTFTGGLRLNAGVANISFGSNMGGLSGFLQFSGGTLRVHSNMTIAIRVSASSGVLDTNGNNVALTGDLNGLGGIDATFTKGGAGTLTLNNDGSGFVGTFIVDEGTLVSGAGDTFSDRATVQVNSGGTLRFDGNENFGGVSGDGTINVNGQAMRIGYFDTNGEDFAGELIGSGQVVKDGIGTQRFSGDNTGFTGSFVITQGTLAFATGESAGQMDLSTGGGSIRFTPDAGTSSEYHGVISGSGGLGVSGAGSITLTGNSSGRTGIIDVSGGGTLYVDGQLGGSFALLTNGATVGGSGTIATDVLTSAGTTIAPGSSAGILTAESVNFVDGSTLEIELGGATAGTGYDRLVANDDLTLDGTLDVTLIDKYDPTAGTVFDILDWGTLTGTFDEVLLPALSTGLVWDDAALYTTGELKVESNGDLNGDGFVGVEDLDIILAHWGDTVVNGTLALGDADGSGVVGQGDLAVVQANFGTSPGVNVPEPGTLALLALGVFGLPRRRPAA